VKTQAIAAFGTAALLSACSGISTSTDFDPSVSFASYSTYGWLDTEGDVSDNILDSRIKGAVDQALAAKGLRKVDGAADLAIGYQVTTAERRSYNTVNTGWGGGYYWGGWGMGMGTSTTYENTWQEGTLVLGMFDSGSKNMVWTGSATGTIDPSNSPEERQELIQNAVNKMLTSFPPGS